MRKKDRPVQSQKEGERHPLPLEWARELVNDPIDEIHE